MNRVLRNIKREFRKSKKDLSTDYELSIWLPVIASIMTYMTLVLFLESQLTKDQLVKHPSVVRRVFHTVGVNDNALTIEAKRGDYLLHSRHHEQFGLLLDSISAGDSLNIYVESKLLSYINISKGNFIYEIEKGNRVLFSLEHEKQYSKGALKWFLPATVCLWGLYLLLRPAFRRKTD